MKNFYEQLVEQYGKEYADAYMKQIGNHKNKKGGAFRDPEFAKQASAKAAEARKAKQNETKEAP